MVKVLSAVLVAGGLFLAPVVGMTQTTPAPAPKAEKKCDTKGKECKDGKDCKVENCKVDDTQKSK